MDPRFNPDGTPYKPKRFKDIVKERYYISRYINTSYADTGDITPLEREYILEFIVDEKKQEAKARAEAKFNSRKN